MTIGRKLYNGMDAFNEGAANSQKMFDSIANRKNQAGQLAVNQQNADRAQTILPYLLQQYKDSHDKSPLEREYLGAQIKEAMAKANESTSNVNFNNQFNSAVNGVNPTTQQQAQTDMTPSQMLQAPQPINSGNSDNSQSPEDKVIMANGGMSTTPQSPIVNSPNKNAGEMSRHDLVSKANQDQAIKDAGNQRPINNIPNPNAATNPQSNANNQMQPSDPLTQPWNGKPGDIVIREPGNQKAYAYDKMAGGTIAGRHYEPIKRETVDGVETVTYPISGKVTQQKVGPSEEEKATIRENSKVSASERLKNKTESDKMEDSARSIINLNKQLDELDSLLKKDKNVTGIMPGLATKLHMSKDPNKAEILTKIKDIQAGAAKAESSRPGIGMVNFYNDMKPSMWNDPKFNAAQVKALRDKNKQALEGIKEDWMRKNPGKQFPKEYDIPEKSTAKHFVWNPATGRPEPK